MRDIYLASKEIANRLFNSGVINDMPMKVMAENQIKEYLRKNHIEQTTAKTITVPVQSNKLKVQRDEEGLHWLFFDTKDKRYVMACLEHISETNNVKQTLVDWAEEQISEYEKFKTTPSKGSERFSAPGDVSSSTKPIVDWFADQMEYKLSLNRHKGDREGWLSEDVWTLYMNLLKEKEELFIDMKEERSLEHILSECADIANFAMMIADKYRIEEEKQTTPSKGSERFSAPGDVRSDEALDAGLNEAYKSGY